MKNLFRTYPEWTRLILGAVLIAAALIVSGFIHLPYIPAGLLLVILVTWQLFRSEKKDLTALGFDFRPRHLLFIPIGLLLGLLSFLLSFYVGTLVRGDHIMVSHTTDWKDLLKVFWQVFPTAAVQDFVVVGYCYLKLIRLTNSRVATLVFGFFFISMHDVWGGDPINLFFYASGLFVGYLMFSTALRWSGSIWLVIGIHWGNNFTNSYLFTFSRTPTSLLFLNMQQQQNLNVWQAIGLYIALNIGAATVTGLMYLFWKNRDRPEVLAQNKLS